MVPTEPGSIHSSLNLTTATWLQMEMEIVIWTKLKRKQMLLEITASRRNWSAGVPATSGRKISMRRLQGAGGATLAGGGRRRGGRRRGTRSRTVPAAAFAPPPRSSIKCTSSETAGRNPECVSIWWTESAFLGILWISFVVSSNASLCSWIIACYHGDKLVCS